MTDLDQLSGVLFIVLLVLSIVIAVLGVSVLARLLDAAGLPQGRSPLPATVLLVACVLGLAFFSIHLPFLALLPAGGFCLRGLWLLRHRGVLNRDGGIVLLLVGADWLVLAGIQATLVAWQKTVAGAPIRMDILLTLPLASMAAILGWILLDRLPVVPSWKPERKPVSILGLLLLAILAGTPAARAASPEETLNARWRGGWVIVKLPIASNCDGFYNDNEIVGNRADSRARRRFAAGELANVERIEVKRNRMDVFLDLAEQVLEPREDGPFTLYDARACKVQLKVGLAGGRDGAAGPEARLSEVLELHATAEKAEGSPSWSGRRREPYPEGYERTLAEYESWKATQLNAAVQERMDDAIDEASRVKERIRSDPEYLEGFAAGIEKVRDTYFGDCASLTRQTFSPASPPGGHDSDWKRGYEDGQRLGHDLELLRRLRSCFVAVPAPEP